MSQIDYVAFLPLLITFILLFFLINLILTKNFLPLIFTSLKVRSNYFKNLNNKIKSNFKIIRLFRNLIV